MNKKILGVIPARYQSTRLPGKPLVDIGGKPMVQWVYEAASQALSHVVVATDDARIAETVRGFGGQVVLTAADHVNGTSRCLEAWATACELHNTTYDLIVNIQGDEPLLQPQTLAALVACFDDPSTEFATLVTPVQHAAELQNNSEVFVTFSQDFYALYFSRSVIPFLRDVPREDWLAKEPFYKHLGLYAYTPATLEKFSASPVGRLERMESLEQLRWLENGGKIRVAITPYSSIPVDTPADLEQVRKLVQSKLAQS
jgi:3-deoxy-manno-octulosonate cytidylyltransferase (CMP-KDO synthetase)